MSRMIDLRSDFLVRPTPQMIDAMSGAARAAPVFEAAESGPVRQLEETMADMLGHEAALFCPTVTICNQIAINILTSPGDTLICESDSHIVTSEAGAPAALSGVMIHGIATGQGRPCPASFRDALHLKHLSPRLVVVENTHTRSGGCVMSARDMTRIAAQTAEAGAALFLDGARLFNAACHLNTPLADLARPATMVSISMGKGPGAPMGAILAGGRDDIARATRVRQRFGGYWRPAGMLAAAALIGLETTMERLAEVHATARRFADAVRAMEGARLKNDPVETNLVLVELENGPGLDAAIAMLDRGGVRALQFDGALRFAFHRDVTPSDTRRAIDALAAIVAGRTGPEDMAGKDTH